MGQAITPGSGSIKQPSQTSCSTQRNLSNGLPPPSNESRNNNLYLLSINIDHKIPFKRSRNS